ncbi:MAG: DUF418 domain-containing protein [Acidobacteriota bacterium]|nr:DUF418 domain-containing protein [Acidobacteriota bacterium]
MQRPEQIAPAQGVERFELLDIVRGLALFGIVTANMISYSMYLYLPEAAKSAMNTHAADRVLDFLEIFLIEGKFYTIFSVLFGVGFSVLLSRGRAKNLVFHRFYLRRIGVLFVIGVAHGVLFWHNDILEAYAVCGALLLPFVTARDRTILTLAVLAYLIPAATKLVGGIPVGVLADAQGVLFQRIGVTRETLIEAWTQGGIGLIVRINAAKLLDQVSFVVGSGMLFKIYGCFLFGFYIGRHEAYRKCESGRSVLKRLAVAGFVIGVPLNAMYAASFDSGSWAETLSGTFGVPTLSCGYVALCCLIWLDTRGRHHLRHFAPVGRMALTNYVGQSVICSLIFYGTGLGLGGSMGPTYYLPIGFAVYAVQVLVSRLWLDRFTFGPLEWVWRMLTYGQRVPLTRGTAV